MSVFGIFFGPIPEIFWSVYSGQPFFECIECCVPLIESNTFVIQKKFVGDEAVFEMAMCERCREKMVTEYSEETRQNISRYIREQFDKLSAEHTEGSEAALTQITELRQIEDPEEGAALLEQCIEYCIVCGAKRADCHRYSLTGLCRDEEIVAQVTPIGRTPLMVCDKCESGMSDLVSQQTRDSWDRFMARHFDGPPGVEIDSPTTYPIAF